MAKECKLPELGENITSATVLDVLVKEGDEIEVDQPLLSLESDKAEFELPSPLAGKITELLVSAGDEIEVGQVVLRVDDGGGDGAGADKADDGAKAEEEAKAEKEEGKKEKKAKRKEEAKEEEPEAEKASKEEKEEGEPKAERAARQKKEPREEKRAEKGDAEPEGEEAEPSAPSRPVAAAPSVRRVARELGVDIAAVAGSGPGGRVSVEDLYRHVRRQLAEAEGKKRTAPKATHDFSRWGKTKSVEMTNVRRRTAEKMSLAWSSIPHVTHHDRADITDLDRLRRQYAKRVEKAGGKLTMTAVLLKVVGSALKRYPKFNATIDMAANAIVYKEYVNVGVAVDTERGLLVPVIHDADAKNIVELALELREVSEAARARKLPPDRLQGATFTVTNLGGIGGYAFSPLINPPEVAVLGVSMARTEPVWREDRFEPRLLLPLSVSYDHRVIDGADAARFLRWVCEALEEPFVMDLEGQ